MMNGYKTSRGMTSWTSSLDLTGLWQHGKDLYRVEYPGDKDGSRIINIVTGEIMGIGTRLVLKSVMISSDQKYIIFSISSDYCIVENTDKLSYEISLEHAQVEYILNSEGKAYG